MNSRKIKLLWQGMLFLLFFLLSTIVLPRLKLPAAHPDIQSMPEISRQPDDRFWITSGQKEISHIALYHDLGESIKNARQADILFIGNSRQQTGFREAIIAEEAHKLGLKVFTIATGHADKTRFALELIRKHDLRPRVVVASGGPFLFTEGVSAWADEVMAMDRWTALKTMGELNAAWTFQSRLHHYLPRIEYFGQALVRGGIKYRSVKTGWWNIEFEPDGYYPVTMAAESPDYRYTLNLAKELKTELDHRGALLVLTMVPYTDTRSGHLAYLSRKLGVPFVLPSFDGMATSDQSHLGRASAMQYSKAFWEEFIQLQVVREKLAIN